MGVIIGTSVAAQRMEGEKQGYLCAATLKSRTSGSPLPSDGASVTCQRVGMARSVQGKNSLDWLAEPVTGEPLLHPFLP